MQATDRAVLVSAKAWLTANKPIWLCTITGTYGSSPRPVGSLFATDGVDRSGSISGGCLEDAFIEQLNDGFFNKSAQLFTYGAHTDNVNRVIELPCGGSIRLLVEFIEPTNTAITHIESWLSKLDSHQPFKRIINLNTLDKTLLNVDTVHGLEVEVSEQSVTLYYAQVWTLLLLGIGRVSELVAQLGIMAGYQVKICDMREELALSWHLPDVAIEWQSPDNFVEQYATSRSAILALAHDPRIDDMGLMTAFQTQAFYIGAMGSVRTSDKRRERLARICQLNEDDLSRLHAPIGLPIGSKTPMEIAIAIMADITRCKSGISKTAVFSKVTD